MDKHSDYDTGTPCLNRDGAAAVVVVVIVVVSVSSWWHRGWASTLVTHTHTDRFPERTWVPTSRYFIARESRTTSA